MDSQGNDSFKVPRIGSSRGRGRGLTFRVDVTRNALALSPPRCSRQLEESLGSLEQVGNKTKPVLKTRPESSENSKEGISGRKVSLSANYFRLNQKPNFEFCLYRVDFEPDLEHVGTRKAFLAQHKEHFGGYLFDGQSQLFLTHRLVEDQMYFECDSREGKSYKLRVKRTPQVIKMTDAMAIQIFNLILRRTMDGLNMQLVGRNLYDPGNKVRADNSVMKLSLNL